jgi:type IV secretory pathway TrbD component
MYSGKEFLDKLLTVVLFNSHEMIESMKVKDPHLMRVVLLHEWDIEMTLFHNRTLETVNHLPIDVLMHLTPESWIITCTGMVVWIVVGASKEILV